MFFYSRLSHTHLSSVKNREVVSENKRFQFAATGVKIPPAPERRVGVRVHGEPDRIVPSLREVDRGGERGREPGLRRVPVVRDN